MLFVLDFICCVITCLDSCDSFCFVYLAVLSHGIPFIKEKLEIVF
jgi:hypothetical protein